MAIPSVGPAASQIATAIQPSTAARASNPASGGSAFSDMVQQLVEGTNSQHQQADESVRQLMTGESDNLHDVVLHAAKADLSFRLLMEIRNRLIDSYQEIMRMQV